MTTGVAVSTEQLRWYPSKIDWWLAPVLGVPPLAAVVVCFASALTGSTPGLLVGVAMAVLVAGFYCGLIFPMRYGLDDTHLVVRFGICRQRIPLADISEVKPTSNPLSAPALSLDRLRVRFGQGVFKAVLISPADRNHFLDELASRAGLRREGDQLSRV
jgi:hypothetical protein